MRCFIKLFVIVAFINFVTVSVAMATSNEDLAKVSQNPVGDLISVPFQNNINFDVGPKEKTQNILNIQPVWPLSLNDNWNVITRTILPVISQPTSALNPNRKFGLGDITFTAFLSPAKPSGVIWGVGPVLLIPTATDKALGSEKWGVGPSLVVLKMQGPWVYGALISNIKSFAGSDDRNNINLMTLQPFVNYNFPSGFYLSSSPVITANWENTDSNRWLVPLGGGVGKVFKLGRLPVNASFQGYYNVSRPKLAARWTIRLQLQFLFPK